MTRAQKAANDRHRFADAYDRAPARDADGVIDSMVIAQWIANNPGAVAIVTDNVQAFETAHSQTRPTPAGTPAFLRRQAE